MPSVRVCGSIFESCKNFSFAQTGSLALHNTGVGLFTYHSYNNFIDRADFVLTEGTPRPA